jgi:hypothetical protein
VTVGSHSLDRIVLSSSSILDLFLGHLSDHNEPLRLLVQVNRRFEKMSGYRLPGNFEGARSFARAHCTCSVDVADGHSRDDGPEWLTGPLGSLSSFVRLGQILDDLLGQNLIDLAMPRNWLGSSGLRIVVNVVSAAMPK